MIDGVYDPRPGAAGPQGRRAGHGYEKLTEQSAAREIKRLEKAMYEHAKNLEFEQAARVRDQLMQLKATVFGGGATGPDTITGAAVESTGRVA